MRRTALALVLGITALSSCSSDNNGPGGGTTLTVQQRTALTTALLANGSLGAEAAAFAPFALSQLQEAGTMGDYTAVGIQVKYNITAGGETQSGIISSITGWQGLNASAQTVDKIIAASQFSTGSTFPTSGTSTFDTDAALGSYFDRSTTSNYLATGGTFNLTGASFGGGNTSCNQSSGGITITCSYSTGTMTGSFGFDAARQTGTGATTFSQPSTSFDLPAVRLTISITQ